MPDLDLTNLAAAVTVLIGGIGAIWQFYTRLIAPARIARQKQQAEEAAKQREHEREMAEARAAADRSEELARWEQMVKLQNSQSATLESLLDFIIGLATERLDKLNENLAARAGSIAHELREIRANLSILVNEARRQEDYRDKIGRIPDYLIEFQNRQHEIYQLITKMNPND